MTHVRYTPFHQLPPWEARKALTRERTRAISGDLRGLGLTPAEQATIDIMGPVWIIVSRALPTVIRTIPLPDHIDTVRASVLQLQAAEDAAIATTNAYIARHNAGRMLPDEYAEYDGLRHSIHDAQVAYHSALRQACYDSFGRAAGDQIIARVPYPGWFPRLDTPHVAPVNADTPALAGLGALPPLAIAAIVLAVIAGLALLVHEVTKFVDATSDAMIARAQASTLQRIVEQREASYLACVNRGIDPATCRREAIALTQDLRSALDELTHLQRMRRLRRAIGGIGTILGVAGAIALGVYVYRKRHAIKASLTGLGRLGSGRKRRRKKRSKPRKRRAKTRRSHRRSRGVRGLGGATPLRSLNDNVPSRYMLEV